MTSRLAWRHAIITGGAAGIGLAIARAFVREGAAVALVDVDEAKAVVSAEGLAGAGARAIGLGADVTDEDGVAAAVERARSDLGSVDILVNNAGIAVFGRVDNTSLADWDRVLGVNLTGTFLMSRSVVPIMLEQNRGAIVNLGSVAGLVGIGGMAAYCAAKGAIVNLTRQMAADYSGQGIRVNCICPGTVGTTDLGRQLLGTDTSEAGRLRRLAKYPIGRLGEPEEIAEAALFLVSDEASFVTGAAFAVDGGMTAI
jgi:NAD(P)-dependent dehydrogenase (short-subunit alcohol dehydrogenase family)